MASSSKEDNGILREGTATSIEGDSRTTKPARPPVSEAPYTIFSHMEVILLVALASMAACLGPLAANIYYPAILDLSEEFNVSTDLINLTITVYLIFQGMAPTFIGSISDAVGRRPAYVFCFIIYLAANLGLALQGTYAGLIVLRCLQSTGSSGTIALGNALVADIATSSKRGTYMGYATLGALLGPAVAPVVGGLLDEFLGWRSIFWFLVIMSATFFLILVIVLPETCRSVVGNGSLPPQKWNISLLTFFTSRRFLRSNSTTPEQQQPRAARRSINLLGTIRIIFSKEAFCILLYTGFLFGGFFAVIAAIPLTFATVFAFQSLRIGLCYLPFGFGCMIAAVATGKTVDWNFRRLAKRLNHTTTPGQQNDLSNFPIEKARIQVVIPLVCLGIISIVAYAFAVAIENLTARLAVMLVLLFLLGFSISGAFNAFSTLMVDLYPESPGTATAAANLIRCFMGAGAVAGIGPLMYEIGDFTYLVVAGCWVCSSPILWIVWKYGPAWREERRIRERAIAELNEEGERSGQLEDIPLVRRTE